MLWGSTTACHWVIWNHGIASIDVVAVAVVGARIVRYHGIANADAVAVAVAVVVLGYTGNHIRVTI